MSKSVIKRIMMQRELPQSKIETTYLKSKIVKIISNRCKCTHCGDIIESKGVHDFVACSCGRIFTDGGTEYIHRGSEESSDIQDLTIYEEVT